MMNLTLEKKQLLPETKRPQAVHHEPKGGGMWLQAGQ